MSRRTAREIAMHIIFETEFKTLPLNELIALRFDEEIFGSIAVENPAYGGKLSEKQKEYIITTCNGVKEKEEEIYSIISEKSVKWDIGRISKVSKAVLLLAIYEMKYVEDVPVGVAINEAVDLAKEYDSKEAATFINGILGSIAREE